MRLLTSFFATCALFVASCVYAQTNPCPGEFGLSVEYLYMNQAIDQPYFAIDIVAEFPEEATHLSYEQITPHQDWHSGYRAELIYAFCNCFNDVRFRWTHFPEFSNSVKVHTKHDPDNGPFGLTPAYPSPTFTNGITQGQATGFTFVSAEDAKVKQDYTFYYLDVLLGQKIIDCSCFTLDVQGGIQYAHLRLIEDQTFHNAQAFLNGDDDTSPPPFFPCELEYHFRSRLSGVGPQIGTEFNYSFWNCLSFTGRGYGSLLISERKVSRSGAMDVFEQPNGTPGELQQLPLIAQVFDCKKEENYWKVIPTTNLRFGLSYSREIDSCFCGCFQLDLEVGYEALWFFRAFERPMFTGTVIATQFGTDGAFVSNNIGATNDFITYSVHGPYFHVGISF